MRTPSLALYLSLALLVRLPAVLWARGYEFVDSHFQYVDPAWGLATGAEWHRSWEWQEGIRSWAYPGLLAGIFRTALALGFADPSATMVFVRLAHALVSLLPLAALWLCVVRWRPLPNAGAVLWCAAASFVVVYAGVHPSGPTFALGLSLAAIFFFHGPGLWPVAAGLCLGCAFACRFQDAFFGPVLFVAGLVQRRPRAALLLCLGCVPPVMAQGWLDLRTWGSFLHSAFGYVRVNFVEGKSAGFGTTPLWVFLLSVLAFFVPVVPAAWRAFRRGAALLPIPCACALFYLLMHALPERRQLRFALPSLALLSIVLAAGLAHESARDRVTLWYRRLLLSLHALLLALASCWYFHRGAIEAALLLRADPSYEGRLCTVDTGFVGIGGAYWLGRRELRLEVVEDRRELARWLRAREARWPLHVLVKGEPLTPVELGAGFVLEELGRTSDPLDLQRSKRRVVYRVRPE